MPRVTFGPGAGKYMLPPLTGYPNHDISKYRNPQYSFGLRTKLISKKISPGPKYDLAGLNEYGKGNIPAYTIKSRPIPLKPFETPGPYYYTYRTGPWPPVYHIVSRKAPLKPFVTPGPNQYPAPLSLGCKIPDKMSAPCYSMRYRHHLRELERSPGPARYDAAILDRYKNRQPKYSIRQQLTGVKPKGLSPGPAAYYPVVKPCKRGITMQSRADNMPYITPEDNMPCINK